MKFRAWFLCAAVLQVLPVSADQAGSGKDVPAKHEAVYWKDRPKQFLIDPQGLLAREDSQELIKFLNYHSSDSAIDLVVFLFEGDQRLPEGSATEEAVGRWYGKGKPTVVLQYFMGQPKRARWFMSPALAEVMTPEEQAYALRALVEQAETDVSPGEQLEKFLIHLSIRIGRIERKMRHSPEADGELLGHAEPVVAEAAPPRSRREEILAMAKPYLLPAVGGVFGLVLLVLLRIYFKRRARYEFPDLEVEPRLGGRHAAGIGAVLSFAQATVSPNAQKGH